MYAYQSNLTGTIYVLPVVGETTHEKLVAAATAAFHKDEFSLLEYAEALTTPEGKLYQKVA